MDCGTILACGGNSIPRPGGHSELAESYEVASILVAMTALVLFSHGSLLCGSGEAVDAHADRLRRAGIADRVEVGYLNYSDPLFSDTVDRLVESGVESVVVVPYFLAPGYFVSHSLPDALGPVRERYPDVRFSVADVLGEDSRWEEVVLESARGARDESHWDDPLGRAGSACRNRPDCPLNGTPDCPCNPGGSDA